MTRTRCSVLTLFALVVLSAKALTAQDFPPALVVTEPVQMMEFHDQLALIGRSQARAESRIVAEVSGRVRSINAEEGTWISRGSPLVRIDSERIKLSLDAKTAEAAQARAEADLASKELARAEDLYKQETLPERTLDDAISNATRTLERYNQLEAERKQLELDLNRCTIRAPYSGYTIRYLVQIGEWVSPGTPVYEMVDLSVAKVTVDLPERHFGHLEIGSEVNILISSDDSSPVVGTVTGIAPQASSATHTFPVIVTVPNEHGRLGSGMLVRATVSLRERFSSLAVSKDAIIRQGNQTIVYTVVEGKATPIPVSVSSSNGMMVAVSGEGLEDGMPVVVRGNERIFPGSPVQTPEDAQGGGEAGQEEPEETSQDQSASKGNE